MEDGSATAELLEDEAATAASRLLLWFATATPYSGRFFAAAFSLAFFVALSVLELLSWELSPGSGNAPRNFARSLVRC